MNVLLASPVFPNKNFSKNILLTYYPGQIVYVFKRRFSQVLLFHFARLFYFWNVTKSTWLFRRITKVSNRQGFENVDVLVWWWDEEALLISSAAQYTCHESTLLRRPSWRPLSPRAIIIISPGSRLHTCPKPIFSSWPLKSFFFSICICIRISEYILLLQFTGFIMHKVENPYTFDICYFVIHFITNILFFLKWKITQLVRNYHYW